MPKGDGTGPPWNVSQRVGRIGGNKPGAQGREVIVFALNVVKKHFMRKQCPVLVLNVRNALQG